MPPATLAALFGAGRCSTAPVIAGAGSTLPAAATRPSLRAGGAHRHGRGRPLRLLPAARGVIYRDPGAGLPRYIEALLGYEDRYFWRYPGLIRWPWCAGSGSGCAMGEPCRGLDPHQCRWRVFIEPYHRSVPGKLRQMARALQLKRTMTSALCSPSTSNRSRLAAILRGAAASLPISAKRG